MRTKKQQQQREKEEEEGDEREKKKQRWSFWSGFSFQIASFKPKLLLQPF